MAGASQRSAVAGCGTPAKRQKPPYRTRFPIRAGSGAAGVRCTARARPGHPLQRQTGVRESSYSIFVRPAPVRLVSGASTRRLTPLPPMMFTVTLPKRRLRDR